MKRMSPSPVVSVVMAVHNGERFLSESIESILSQDFSDLEFIIIDDGSTDSAPDIIARYAQKDRRILSVRRERKGLTKSLNEGLALSRGRFIARHDGDDISLPHRLSAMVSFLDANPLVDVVGSWGDTIDEAGRVTGKVTFPLDHDHIAWAMSGGNVFLHPSVVFRRECIAKYGPYDESYTYAQDYELWARWIMRGAKFANLPEMLVRYRREVNQISTKFFLEQTELAISINTTYVNFLLSDALSRRQVLGLRQIIGSTPIDSDALYAIPTLVRLFRLPAFRQSIRRQARVRPARRAVRAISQFGAADQKTAVAGLAITPFLWGRILLERPWWICLAKQISFYRL